MLAFGSVPAGRGRAPAAWQVAELNNWQAIRTTPATGYGKQAEFIMAAVADNRISAFGQAYGGAHSNPRPTLWRGSTAGLVEHEQPITLLGGEDAIGQAAESATRSLALIVGSWDPPGARYGAATWTSRDGVHWTRHSTPPGMASGPGEQTSALGVTDRSGGFLAAGQSLTGTGTVPLAWTSSNGATWLRTALPLGATSDMRGATAVAPVCGSTSCVLIGNSTSAPSRLLCWKLPLHGSAAVGATVAAEGPGGSLVEPLQATIDRGTVEVLARIDGRVRLFSVTPECAGWHETALPAHAQIAALAVLGGRLVIATTGTTASRLWTRATR